MRPTLRYLAAEQPVRLERARFELRVELDADAVSATGSVISMVLERVPKRL